MVASDQLTNYFENIFHSFLCAFRTGHGCQTTLLELLEDRKSALDKKHVCGSYIKLLIVCHMIFFLSKLSAYGFISKSVELLENYLTGRKQQIKTAGSSQQLGVLQGYILDPLLLNIFINDIFSFIDQGTLNNNVDDSTLYYADYDFDNLIFIVLKESTVLIE